MRFTARKATPGIKRTIMRWTMPWAPFFLTFLLAWVRYPLELESQDFPIRSVFLIAFAGACLLIAATSKQSSSLFDAPIAGRIAFGLLFAGTFVIAAPLVGLFGMSGHVAPLPGGPLVAAPSVSGLGDAATAGL